MRIQRNAAPDAGTGGRIHATGVRKIATSLRVGRDPYRVIGRILLSTPLLGPEEERLTFVTVVATRNENWSANRVSEIVPLVRRLRSRRICKVAARVKKVVTPLVEKIAVKRFGAGLSFDFDSS